MKNFLEFFFVLTVGENKGGGHSESERLYNNRLRVMNGILKWCILESENFFWKFFEKLGWPTAPIDMGKYRRGCK
jgi:hypothetical protein